MRRLVLVTLLLVIACQKPEAPAAVAKKKPAARPVVARTEVGDVMPAYSSQYLDGKPFDLASEKGSVVLVNVWATWCGPCRMEIPELQKLHDKYRDRGFKVLGVSVDDTGVKDVQKFVADQKMSYPVLLDADGKLANVLQTTVLPTSVILSRDGKILWRQVGALMPNDVQGVEQVIEKATAKS